jgi:hypothetical protein
MHRRLLPQKQGTAQRTAFAEILELCQQQSCLVANHQQSDGKQGNVSNLITRMSMLFKKSILLLCGI